MNSDGWEERPYGWKLKTGENSQLLRINPRASTVSSARAGELGKFWLKRSDDDTAWETVEHLGYADGTDDGAYSLFYTALPEDQRGPPINMYFKKGDKFYSVNSDKRRTGFYNGLKNDSNKVIELKIEWAMLDQTLPDPGKPDPSLSA